MFSRIIQSVSAFIEDKETELNKLYKDCESLCTKFQIDLMNQKLTLSGEFSHFQRMICLIDCLFGLCFL